jgi:hypothetical protein
MFQTYDKPGLYQKCNEIDNKMKEFEIHKAHRINSKQAVITAIGTAAMTACEVAAVLTASTKCKQTTAVVTAYSSPLLCLFYISR